MPILDVTAPSNWTSVSCSRVLDSEEAVGWTGSAYFSEGKVFFSNSLNTAGIRVKGIDVGYYAFDNPSMTNAYIWMKVVLDGSVVLFEEYLGSRTHIDLDSYDETIKDISSITLETTHNWTIYAYFGGGGTGATLNYLTVYDLDFSYDLAVPPYRWTTYRNAKETIID